MWILAKITEIVIKELKDDETVRFETRRTKSGTRSRCDMQEEKMNGKVRMRAIFPLRLLQSA